MVFTKAIPSAHLLFVFYFSVSLCLIFIRHERQLKAVLDAVI
jgi:hypothetical protein